MFFSVLIFVLLCLSAFFSLSETVLTTISPVSFYERSKQGCPQAKRVLRLLDRREKMIASLLLGNNLTNILASSLTTALFLKLFGERGIAMATGMMTLVILTFCEIFPKNLAIQYSTTLALRISRPMSICLWLFTWPINGIQLFVHGIFKLFRLRTSTPSTTTESELRGIIALHGLDDQQLTHRRNMLKSILDLETVMVGDIMTHRKNVVTLCLDDPFKTIQKQVLKSAYTRLPVWQGDPSNIVGILHIKSFLQAKGFDDTQQTSDNQKRDYLKSLLMTPWYIPETTVLRDQLQAFRAKREHFGLVIDEYGGLLGIVTLEDILEEIVGEIIDESDITPLTIHEQDDGSVLVSGDTTLRDLNRQFGWELPDDEAATLAGFLLYQSREIMKVGDTFTHQDFHFEIRRRHRNQVTLIRVLPPKA